MIGWDELLRRLAETPRENGSAALHETARFLAEMLERAGAQVELFSFTAHPHALRLAGVLALVGGLLYRRWLREGRAAAALAVAILVPTLNVAEVDRHATPFGWIGAQTQHHVEATLPVEGAERRLLITAHYDTKTDLLDHVARAPIELVGPVVIVMMAAVALAASLLRGRGRAAARLQPLVVAASVLAPLYGVALFLALSAGAFVPRRSPGALDDGAACAVLVKLVESLRAEAPLSRTEVGVVLFSAEEVGVQGSWEYARARYREPPALPTFVVNLEMIGASEDLSLLPRETFTLRSYAPPQRLVELLDGAHRELRGAPLRRMRFGGATDARSFLAHGVPAATLMSHLPSLSAGRGLHSARDERSRLDPAALDATLDYLRAVARALDAAPL